MKKRMERLLGKVAFDWMMLPVEGFYTGLAESGAEPEANKKIEQEEDEFDVINRVMETRDIGELEALEMPEYEPFHAKPSAYRLVKNPGELEEELEAGRRRYRHLFDQYLQAEMRVLFRYEVLIWKSRLEDGDADRHEKDRAFRPFMEGLAKKMEGTLKNIGDKAMCDAAKKVAEQVFPIDEEDDVPERVKEQQRKLYQDVLRIYRDFCIFGIGGETQLDQLVRVDWLEMLIKNCEKTRSHGDDPLFRKLARDAVIGMIAVMGRALLEVDSEAAEAHHAECLKEYFGKPAGTGPAGAGVPEPVDAKAVLEPAAEHDLELTAAGGEAGLVDFVSKEMEETIYTALEGASSQNDLMRKLTAAVDKYPEQDEGRRECLLLLLRFIASAGIEKRFYGRGLPLLSEFFEKFREIKAHGTYGLYIDAEEKGPEMDWLYAKMLYAMKRVNVEPVEVLEDFVKREDAYYPPMSELEALEYDDFQKMLLHQYNAGSSRLAFGRMERNKTSAAPLDDLKQFLEENDPEILAEKLGEYIAGQEAAKQMLAGIVYYHIERIVCREEGVIPQNVRKSCTNALLIGPSGVGKSSIMRALKSILPAQIPVIFIDIPSKTGEGYKGRSIREELYGCFKRLRESGIDPGCGIIFFDEIDKVIKSSSSGDGQEVANELLGIVDNDEITCNSESTAHGSTETIVVDSSNLTFVFSGCFQNISRDRRREARCGFLASEAVSREQHQDVKSVQQQMIDAGYKTELIGRCGQIIFMDRLNQDDYLLALDSCIEKSERRCILEASGSAFVLTESARKKIAAEASSRALGVRGLDGIVDGLFFSSIAGGMKGKEIIIDDQRVTEFLTRTSQW